MPAVPLDVPDGWQATTNLSGDHPVASVGNFCYTAAIFRAYLVEFRLRDSRATRSGFPCNQAQRHALLRICGQLGTQSAYARRLAARDMRSLSARPRPRFGTDITAIRTSPSAVASASNWRRPANNRAVASVRLALRLRQNTAPAPCNGGPKASSASSRPTSTAFSRTGRSAHSGMRASRVIAAHPACRRTFAVVL